MNHRISGCLLSELSGLLATATGLHFPSGRRDDLERGLRSAAAEFQFSDAESCARWLLSSGPTKSQVNVLVSHLTVGETYFFRDQRTFDVLEDRVLPELIQLRRGGDRRLRIWSAACCSGEEPYSVAISLRRSLHDLANWDLTILGSDINPRFLEKASQGVFSEWSFRNAPAWLKDRYFKPLGDGRWQILPEIQRMVRLRQINLAENVYPSPLNEADAMDVIFCRNVLIYFSPDQAKKVLHRLYRSLREGGWLVLGPSETPHVLYPKLEAVHFGGAILYRKNSNTTTTIDMRARTQAQPKAVLFLPPPEPVTEAAASAPSALAYLSEAARETVPQQRAYDQATALYEQGLYVQAAEILEARIAEAQEPREMMLLARTRANQGSLAEALLWCDRVVADDKLNTAAHYLRASILQERGDADEAAAALNRVLYLDPDFVLAHFALGNLARNQRKFREADKHFANALALAGRYPQDEVLPEPGLTAGRLSAIAAAMAPAETQ